MKFDIEIIDTPLSNWREFRENRLSDSDTLFKDGHEVVLVLSVFIDRFRWKLAQKSSST
jgi:hypothetical protein